VIYRGDPSTSSFSAWWLKERRLQAVFVMHRPDEERELAPSGSRITTLSIRDMLR